MAVQLSQLSHHTSQRVRHPVSIGLRNKIQRKLQRIFHFHEHKTPVPCAIGFLWTGFYRVMPKGGSPEGSGQELVLGPFQGPVACMHIAFGRGVCGTAWQRKETIVVPDVEQFPGHIACSSLSRSEIVVPLFSKEGEVTAVLDIDSKELATFDETDRRHLETICRLFESL